MSGNIPDLIPLNAFGDWFFGSPARFPTVLTLMQLRALVWAVSSDYNETPMAGVLAYQFGADSTLPDPVRFVRVGTASPWAFCAFDNSQPWNDVFSLIYQRPSDGVFSYIFRIRGSVLNTSFGVDGDPSHIDIGINFVQTGSAQFLGTNFQAIALRKPNGADVLAVVDVTYGLSSPAWVVDFERQTLYLPGYSPGRPINPDFSLLGVPLTTGEVVAVTATTVVVLAAVLAALPFVREAVEYLAHYVLDFLSNYFPITGYASTALGAVGSVV